MMVAGARPRWAGRWASGILRWWMATRRIMARWWYAWCETKDSSRWMVLGTSWKLSCSAEVANWATTSAWRRDGSFDRAPTTPSRARTTTSYGNVGDGSGRTHRRGRRVGLRAAAPSSNVVRQQRCASRRHLTPPHRTYVARSPPRPPPPPPPPARSGPGNAASSATGQFNKEAAHFSGDTTHVLADARADKRTDRRVGRRRPDGLENLELLLQHPDERPHHTRHFGKEDAKEAQKVSSSWGRV
mmetsp:Transcript_3145/g.10404  ORF Transcript_3145/g.10404 Transcript_3145/m.10404 type:complete len:244 (+) Transcript_3145:339-1070(+)